MPQLELYLRSGNEISEYFPHPQQFTADLHCYYSKPQTQLSVNTVLRSVFMVCWHLGSVSSHWGWAFTSRWVHKSTQRYVLWPYVGIVRCFHDKCKNNTWIRGTILKERRERGIIAAPCWLLCTGRRTSVCLTGLRTPLEQSSVCSHVRPELQEKQSYPTWLPV